MAALVAGHDCLLLDLDGTVFRGHQPTVGAVQTLATVPARKLFVTNNASRTPAEVAEHLCALGFQAAADDVVTSAQSAANLLATRVVSGSRVLVVGTDALAAEVQRVGCVPVRRFDDEPVAVVQGHSPRTGWPDLAEAALAIRAGALWVAANVDRTLPSERGLLPGNGAMVAALRAATDREPVVAGKPQPALLNDALARGTFSAPLVVGDRLDTDIAGANAAGLPSLMVLTGVNTAEDVIRAPAAQRPGYLAPDLRSLYAAPDELRVGPHPAWRIEIRRDDEAEAQVVVHGTGREGGDALSAVRATAAAVWDAGLDGRFGIVAGDAAARQALEAWAVVTAADRLA